MNYDLSRTMLAMSDPALRLGLMAQYPDFRDACVKFIRDTEPKPAIKPLPSWSAITGLQAGICDNWPSAKPIKGRPDRWGIVIEAWTATDEVHTHKKGSWDAKASAWLKTRNDLLITAKRAADLKRKQPISDAYIRSILDTLDAMTDDDLAGLLVHKSPRDGTTYHNQQWVLARDIESDPRVELHLGSDARVLNRFSPFQPDGKTRLTPPWIAQSRADFIGFSTNWATGEWDTST